jgi:hypothetical protein
MKKYEEISIDVPKYSKQWKKHLREDGLINTEQGKHRAVEWVAETLERADEEFDISLMSLYWVIYHVGNLLLDKYGIELDEYYTKEQSEFLSMIYARLDEKDKWEDNKRNHILKNQEYRGLFELHEQLDTTLKEELKKEPQEQPKEMKKKKVVKLKSVKRGEV